ncbi:MAG: undecaprenyldiphospho-muramoylpentapeptide beta-N-acetylglucosaminyltransferase [Candidatus Cloacimonetes bacterium]|nr:undecaprenyldiphospho-muramoylpentapeptide beta-N-acetylglucosaminyltransferase [Candidatus Cloacimonadota bacterium]
MRFAFGAGGTGGHIVPAIALARELKSRGHECIFIGNASSMEERLAQKHSLSFFPIKVQKLYRSLNPDNLLFPYYLAGSILKSRRILKDEHIDGVITTGGFVSGPVAIAAISHKVPCFLHESNSYPGLSTRYLSRYLHRTYISFEQSRPYLPKAKLKNFGIPILESVRDTGFSLTTLGLKDDRPTILISGGSQGSLAINSVVSSVVGELLSSGWQILWQTGSLTYKQFYKQHNGKEGLYIFDFNSELSNMMKKVNLAITRAGAMTIAELEAAALPAILIPLPTAAENHQYYNALAQKNKGVAELLVQSELNPQNLLATIKKVEPDKLRKALLALPANTATEQIVTDILSFY